MSKGSTTQIERLQVEGGFLDQLDLRFSPGLNVLVGARGTGKTSVIELLRFCTNAPALADRYGKRAREHALSILRDGKAILTLIIDGERHVLQRTAREESIEIAGLLPIVLSQNEIELVGLDERGRLRLIDEFRPVDEEEGRAALAAMSSIRSLSRELADTDGELAALQERLAQLPALERELGAAEASATLSAESIARASDLLKSLDDLSRETAAQSAAVAMLERTRQSIDTWLDQLNVLQRRVPRPEPWPASSEDPLAEVRHVADDVTDLLAKAVDRGVSAIEILELEAARQKVLLSELDDEARGLRREADVLQAGAGEATRRLSELRETAAQLLQLASVQEQHRIRRAQALDVRSERLEELEALRRRRFEQRRQIEAELNQALNPRVRVTLRRGGLSSSYAAAIADSLKGSGLHYAQLAPLLAERVAPSELASAVEDGRADWLADVGEISVERAARVLEQLRNQGVGDILTAPIEDAVLLELLDGSGGYKGTDEVSTGQRCTMVLPVVLQHDRRPIILDQPEDHLDTAFIVETLVRALRERPSTSQLIISTHNANVPVLGEADRVTILGSDGLRGFVRHAGALDESETVESIEQIMEGGHEAFVRRAEFYADHAT